MSAQSRNGSLALVLKADFDDIERAYSHIRIDKENESVSIAHVLTCDILQTMIAEAKPPTAPPQV